MPARPAILLVLLAGWLAMAGNLHADGKVFSQVTAVKTTTPDQRALVHFADGTETLGRDGNEENVCFDFGNLLIRH